MFTSKHESAMMLSKSLGEPSRTAAGSGVRWATPKASLLGDIGGFNPSLYECFAEAKTLGPVAGTSRNFSEIARNLPIEIFGLMPNPEARKRLETLRRGDLGHRRNRGRRG